MERITHFNKWWWGFSEKWIFEGGKGIVEIQCDNDQPNVMFISGLSVLESDRGKGIGSAILDACEHDAKCKGKRILQLSVENDSHNLISWYRSKGFVEFSIEEKTTTMIKMLW